MQQTHIPRSLRHRWMSLDAVGLCMLWGAVGCCWVLSGVVGCCWMLLDVVGLDIVGCCLTLLDVAGHHWVLLIHTCLRHSSGTSTSSAEHPWMRGGHRWLESSQSVLWRAPASTMTPAAHCQLPPTTRVHPRPLKYPSPRSTCTWSLGCPGMSCPRMP